MAQCIYIARSLRHSVKDEFASTLNLNLSFERPAAVGVIVGKGRIVKRDQDVCSLAAELYQGGELVASVTATALTRALVN